MSPREPECNGICLTGSDIGIPSSEIAYPHPMCPAHGDGCPGYELGRTDGLGREMCENCNTYRWEHMDQLTSEFVDAEIQRELDGGYPDNARDIRNAWIWKTLNTIPENQE